LDISLVAGVVNLIVDLRRQPGLTKVWAALDDAAVDGTLARTREYRATEEWASSRGAVERAVALARMERRTPEAQLVRLGGRDARQRHS
jgi:hypothetical protein